MKHDLVSLRLLACECLQIPLHVAFQVIHSQQDQGGIPSAEQADTPTGWARVPVQGLHHTEPSSPQERPPPDPKGPCPLWQLEGEIEANSTPVLCPQLLQAAWCPPWSGRKGKGRLALPQSNPAGPAMQALLTLSPFNPTAECSDP